MIHVARGDSGALEHDRKYCGGLGYMNGPDGSVRGLYGETSVGTILVIVILIILWGIWNMDFGANND